MEQPTLLPAVLLLDIGLASWGLTWMMEDARRRRFRLLPPLAAAGLVVGCANVPNVGTDVAMTGMPNTEVALRESMRLVDVEIGKLGAMAPPAPPAPAPAPLRPAAAPAPTPLVQAASSPVYPVLPGELQRVIVFTWNGTLEDGVRQLTDSIGYVSVIAPPMFGQVSLPVSIATGPVTVIQALQALGDAAGSHATVRVDPARRQVEVLYHA